MTLTAFNASGASGFLSAFVTATERTLGAAEAGDAVFVRDRGAEAVEAAHLTAAALHECAETATVAAAGVLEVAEDIDPLLAGYRDQAQGRDLATVLGAEALASLYLAGVPRRIVETPVEVGPLFSMAALGRRLKESADVSLALSERLRAVTLG